VSARGTAAVVLLLGCLAAGLPLEAAARRPSAVAQATAGRPDRALYGEAQQAQATLRASAKRSAQRPEWDKVVQLYQKVVARYPQSGFCDDALLAQGDLLRDMATRFKSPRLRDDAEKAYRTLVREYPSSRLGERALGAVFDMAAEGGDRKRMVEAGRAYLDTYPDAPRAKGIRAALRPRTPQPEAPLPTPPPPGLAQVFNLRFWSGASSTRVVIDVEKQLPIKYDRIGKPDRLWVDISGARLHPNLKDRSFAVGDGLLEQVRIGQNKDSVVRIVLEFKDVWEHQVFYLQDPVRLVIDVRGNPPVAAASSSPAPGPAPRPTDAPPTPSPAALPTPAVRAADVPADRPAAEPPAPPDELRPGRRVGDLAPAVPSPSPSPSPRRAPAIVVEGPSPAPARTASKAPAPSPSASPAPTASPPAPAPPRANRAGSYSLARQLGLGARRIVIDAGHGGHDPGSIGRGGLQEKDLVLDVAQRVEQLVREELGAEVVMTRSTDVFVPLEERTAIANARAADLFLSIHANSSRNATARGIETYFLNFAKNPHAEEVAARENAISEATLKDLQNLVKAITLNSKIDESRDFASTVQESLVGTLKPDYPEVLDRGVHTAPFYVLIGANMPSILAEIAFISHPQEEKRLRTPEYRDKIARSLFSGVRQYLDSLNRTQARQLTGATRGNRVGPRSAAR
jgi:N-acetylmuramoyl-L-alanine amidase